MCTCVCARAHSCACVRDREVGRRERVNVTVLLQMKMLHETVFFKVVVGLLQALFVFVVIARDAQ